MVVRDRIILTGDDVNDASVAMNQYGKPYVGLEFKPRGGRVFCDITSENVGRRFAIVLDNKVRSAPVIREAICGGRASVDGCTGLPARLKEASVLALSCRADGCFPRLSLSVMYGQIGASLGADAIAAGKLATMVGGALVLVFMVLFYKRPRA